MTAHGEGASFWGGREVLELRGGSCTTLDILTTTKLYALNGHILWYTKVIPITLLNTHTYI